MSTGWFIVGLLGGVAMVALASVWLALVAEEARARRRARRAHANHLRGVLKALRFANGIQKRR